MKSPADWLAEQVAARPDDFAPDEMAAPLAWIASVQADARKDLERVVRIAADFVTVCQEDGHAKNRLMPAEFDSLADALAALAKPGEPEVSLDDTRCACCGWPLAASADKGCVRGDCSMRPMPERHYDAVRYRREQDRDAPLA